MNCYDTLDEMYLAALKMIFEQGHTIPSRDGYTREIMGFCGRLADPTANFLFNPERKLSPSYAAAETMWYLAGTTDTTMLQAYAPGYKRFTEDGTHAWGAYGDRWAKNGDFSYQRAFLQDEHPEMIEEYKKKYLHFFGNCHKPMGQLEFLLWLLAKNEGSRQAVITMWSPGDLVHAVPVDRKDIPCTLSLNFLVRNKTLYLTTTMRSNDIWLGLPYDVFAFTTLQALLADALRLDLGWYQHQAMSLHVYERNEDKAFEAANAGGFKTGGLVYDPDPMKWHDLMRELYASEQWVRESRGVVKWPNMTTMPAQLLAMAATKFGDKQHIAKKLITNKIMANYIAE